MFLSHKCIHMYEYVYVNKRTKWKPLGIYLSKLKKIYVCMCACANAFTLWLECIVRKLAGLRVTNKCVLVEEMCYFRIAVEFLPLAICFLSVKCIFVPHPCHAFLSVVCTISHVYCAYALRDRNDYHIFPFCHWRNRIGNIEWKLIIWLKVVT